MQESNDVLQKIAGDWIGTRDGQLLRAIDSKSMWMGPLIHITRHGGWGFMVLGQVRGHQKRRGCYVLLLQLVKQFTRNVCTQRNDVVMCWLSYIYIGRISVPLDSY